MYIHDAHPPPQGAYSSWTILKSNDDSPAAKWSSTIGIVTAICGNVLISFALNTQRYAHLRISREREQDEEKQRQERKKQSRGTGYGTQQTIMADARAEANAKAAPARYTVQDVGESNEMDPLIPSVDSLDKQKATESAEDDDDAEEASKKKSYLKSPIWWAGIIMMTLGETGNFLAYGFAPASIVSPLGVVALISNCLIAPWLLKERFRWRDGLGVVIAVAGCVTVVLSASSSNPKLDPDSIWHLITRWEFETYLGITIFLIIILCVASNRFGEKSILIDLGLMGLFGGYTALSTKGVASLLSNTIWRTLTFPITYLLVAVLVFTAIMQIKYVNRALQRFNSTQVIPTQFVLFTLSVIMGSAILYRDFERTSTEQAIKFIGGCALTFLGVWCITSGRNNESEDDEEMEEDEDTINLIDEEGVQPEIRERDDLQGQRQSLIAGSSKLPPNPNVNVVEAALPDEAVELSPAKAAAIHPSPSDLALDATKPQMHATTSDPAIPTINAPVEPPPSTPLKRGHSALESPRKDTPGAPTTLPPRTPAQADRLDPQQAQRLLKRHSVTGFVPGPLTSPLSSSLSAIVADSLRRGVDRFPATSIRRRAARLRTRPGAERISPHAAPRKRHSIASGEMDFDADDNGVEPSSSVPERPGRMRSLSATLGDIFGTPKKRRLGSRDDSAAQAQRRQGGDGAP